MPMMEVGQGHLAYPVLHCVHSSTRETALAPSIAVLDEAITLFAGVCPEQRPDKGAFYPLRQAIAEFLSTLAEAHLEPKGDGAPLPAPRAAARGGDRHREGRGVQAGPGLPGRPAAAAPRPRRGGGVALGGRDALDDSDLVERMEV